MKCIPVCCLRGMAMSKMSLVGKKSEYSALALGILSLFAYALR